MFWNKEIETLESGKMKEIQLERLMNIVHRAYEKVPFYNRKFTAAGIKPEDINSLEDIKKIPFTTKDDLRENYPYDLFAKSMDDIVRIHASSGTTGKPVVVGYTEEDLTNWTNCVTRLIAAAGGRKSDVAQVAFGYGMFTGGFGLHYGLENMGMTVIPASSGNSEKQIMMMKDFGTTVLIGTPSYALYLSEVAEDMGVDPVDLNLRLGLFGGEGHTEEMRNEIEKRWGMKVTENYGLSEIVGPGVSGECTEQQGLHINEDHFYPEIVDPETGENKKPGEKGELVLTTLTKQGIPMLRYRTGDITFLNPEPCSCGRTTTRMNKILGRTDDMLIVKGVNVFPSQIESVLVGMDNIGPHYQIVLRKDGYMDDIQVRVEMASSDVLDNYSALEKIEQEIKKKLRSVLNIEVKVKLVEPRTLARTTGKAKRVVDLRDQD
ncbi:MAG: phenylacetate--CoA ligase family protein [Bacillota bacterium]